MKKTFEELTDEVYSIITSMMDTVEEEGLDMGALVSLTLPMSLDPSNGTVEGALNRGVNTSEAMRNIFIMFCIALMQSKVPVKEIKRSVDEAIRKHKYQRNDEPV